MKSSHKLNQLLSPHNHARLQKHKTTKPNTDWRSIDNVFLRYCVNWGGAYFKFYAYGVGEMSNAQEALKELLNEMARFCQHICNSEPNTTIKGSIESKAFYIGHHEFLLNPEAALSEMEKCYRGNTPVSEPVGYIPKSYELNILANSNDEPLGMVYPTKNLAHDIPLYTSPQPRDWVELSDYAINKLADEYSDDLQTLLYQYGLLLKQLNTKE